MSIEGSKTHCSSWTDVNIVLWFSVVSIFTQVILELIVTGLKA